MDSSTKSASTRHRVEALLDLFHHAHAARIVRAVPFRRRTYLAL